MARRRRLWLAVSAGVCVVGVAGVLAVLARIVPVTPTDNRDAREAGLKSNLAVLRKVLDQYHGDHETYPSGVTELVTTGYLRRVPVDPMTGSNATWVPTFAARAGERVVVNVHSGASGRGADGRPYSEW